jgi:putative membrane protein
MRFLVRLLLNGVAILLAAYLVPGIIVRDTTAALIAGVTLGLVNATIRPVLKILTFPITVLTLGLFTFVINALCFALAAWLVDGFDITGAFPAFVGALLVTFMSWSLSVILVRKRND